MLPYNCIVRMVHISFDNWRTPDKAPCLQSLAATILQNILITFLQFRCTDANVFRRRIFQCKQFWNVKIVHLNIVFFFLRKHNQNYQLGSNTINIRCSNNYDWLTRVVYASILSLLRSFIIFSRMIFVPSIRLSVTNRY